MDMTAEYGMNENVRSHTRKGIAASNRRHARSHQLTREPIKRRAAKAKFDS